MVGLFLHCVTNGQLRNYFPGIVLCHFTVPYLHPPSNTESFYVRAAAASICTEVKIIEIWNQIQIIVVYRIIDSYLRIEH